MTSQPVYLDCAASTPMEPEVIEFITHHFKHTWGNPHSRTHEYGSNARKLIDDARERVAAVVDAKPSEVIFTSGATEANNLVIRSFVRRAESGEQTHVLASCIEHPSVLKPLEHLAARGAKVDLVSVHNSGQVNLEHFAELLRPDTSLVSIMHVNSETGIQQPIKEISSLLIDHPAYLHVDGAQGFGKVIPTLRNSRIDFISASSHKIFGPKGVGALIHRDSDSVKGFLWPLVFGGEQERGLRSGTVPAPLVGAFGLACKLAVEDCDARNKTCEKFGKKLLKAFESVPSFLNGENRYRLASTANIAFEGVDSEAFMILTKDLISVSNGTACASEKLSLSPVLTCMGLSETLASNSVRFSWCHLTPTVDWDQVISRLDIL